MGTIVARKRADGSKGYTAQIVRKKAGKIIHREAQTFDRKQAAESWATRRETELDKPGAIERARLPDKSLTNAIDRHIAESRKAIGRTKAQVLSAIKQYDIANMDCGEVSSDHIVAFANELEHSKTRQHRQGRSEDGLSIDVVTELKAIGFEASHDTQYGGHCDIVIETREGFLWIGAQS